MNIKKIIISLICVIIVISIILLIVLNSNKTEKNDINNNYIEEKIEYGVYKPVKDRQTFFLVKSCVADFLESATNKDVNKLFNLLSESYINKNNITKNNILDKIDTYEEEQILRISKMYLVYENNVNIYYIEGTIRDNLLDDIGEEKEIYLALELDFMNRTFDIIPNKKIDSYKEKSNVKSIKENLDNKYGMVNITDIGLLEIYLTDYIEMMYLNTEKAYAMLDETYKNLRFKTVEDFKEFLTINATSIYQSRIVDYIVDTELDENEEEYNVYTVTTEYGNTYIIKEKSVMDYTVMLDDYTLENKEFIEKYKTADRQNKGIYNIDKFFEMININDYSSAYNVLDENFKQTYFKTEQEFIDFMKSNIYEINKVKYETYMDVTGEIVSYTTKLTDYTGKKAGEIEFDVVMKLINENEFKMSFTIKK